MKNTAANDANNEIIFEGYAQDIPVLEFCLQGKSHFQVLVLKMFLCNSNRMPGDFYHFSREAASS
jgi:hypothetical protein